jgi:DNA-binding transcriptional regulator YiaG
MRGKNMSLGDTIKKIRNNKHLTKEQFHIYLGGHSSNRAKENPP